MRVGFVYSRIRTDEKLLLNALRDRGHTVRKVDVREVGFGLTKPHEYDDASDGTVEGDHAGGKSHSNETAESITADLGPFTDCDVVLDRCVASSRSEYLTQFCEQYGVPVVNGAETARVCTDKVTTSLALSRAGVPTPDTRVAFDPESALATIESFGYPCVLKPVVGSWGRLVAKLDSRSAARAVLEHKETLGHYEHGVFYVQRFVDKPGRDLRIVTAGGEPIAGMTRTGEDWRTNAARGADTAPLEIDDETARLARAASAAVGGGLLGVDLMETGDGYTVHEVNHTVEFTALNETVETDVPTAVVEWLESHPEVAA